MLPSREQSQPCPFSRMEKIRNEELLRFRQNEERRLEQLAERTLAQMRQVRWLVSLDKLILKELWVSRARDKATLLCIFI